jgi:Holliday junction resolvasome RuvABC endonuclease subunit
MRVLGLDLAMNHIGIVLLEKGSVAGWWFLTDHKGTVDRAKANGTHLIVPKTKDHAERQLARMAVLERWLSARILEARPDYIGIEDYAMDQGTMAHLKGEVGWAARRLTRGIPFRLHDPASIKMFVAHDGTADKDMVLEAVNRRWKPPWLFLGDTSPGRVTAEDLCDAMGVAVMTWCEARLRAGTMDLSKLHAKEIQVFNRVTKAHPENILAREWLRLPGPPKIKAVS